MGYEGVYDWGVRRVTSSLTRPDHHIDLMQPSYRRQKPTVSVRRGLLQKVNELRDQAPTPRTERLGNGDDAKYWDQARRQEYAKACKAVRRAYGLTDGLKLEQNDFNDYLARRRAEDKQRRGW